MESFVSALIFKQQDGEFNIMILLAFLDIFIWGRFLMMLQLTRTFGPMIRIILSMFGEVFKFLALSLIVLVCTSSVATLLFGAIEEFSNFVDSTFVIFGTSLGDYDLDVFEENEAVLRNIDGLVG